MIFRFKAFVIEFVLLYVKLKLNVKKAKQSQIDPKIKTSTPGFIWRRIVFVGYTSDNIVCFLHNKLERGL